MRPALRRTVWGSLLLLCLIIAAIVSAPEIEATAWHEPLRKELARALGRPVQLQSVRYQVYPSPGLSATSLVIPDDPAFGVEPLAYVTELQVGVRLTSLVLGRLEVSSVRLVDASVNIAHAESRGWNVSRLLIGMASAARSGNPPALELRACRLNFRFGLVKSSYFLNNVDLNLQPPSESNRGMKWTFEASPARTDRAEQGFGRFTGEGSWSPAGGPDGSIQAEAQLETSALSEVITLLAGRDLGLQGRVSSRTRLKGPVADIRVNGQFEFIEVDRAGLFGFRGKQFRLPLVGSVNLPGQSFDLHLAAGPAQSAQPPLEITLAATNTLVDPAWKAGFLFRAFPAETIADLAQRLGRGLPDGIKVTGSVDGEMTFEKAHLASGQIKVTSATLESPEAGQVSSPRAEFTISGSEIRLAPAEATTPGGASFNASASWNTLSGDREMEVKFTGSPLAELLKPAGALAAPVPLFHGCGEGIASGALRYRSAADSAWTGSLSLAGAVCPVEGTAEPFRAESASFAIRPDGWTLRSPSASWGSLAGSVDLSWKKGARRPFRLDASINEANAAAIEDLFLLTLARNRSLIDRTLAFGRESIPDWLKTRSLSGRVRIARLSFAETEATSVDSGIFWDGASIEFTPLSARIGEASWAGKLRVSLDRSAPSYRLTGRLDDYRHGPVTATLDLDMRSSGVGRQILQNLQASGEYHLLGVEADGEAVQPFRGAFDYSARRNASRLRISSAEAVIGGETFVGDGAMSPDGHLLLDLAGPSHSHRLAVTLSPWSMETRR